jgi:hypothetical protein
MARQNGAEIARQQRRYRVLQAKVAGATVRQIAEQENVSPAQIQKDVHRVLGELSKEHVGMADSVRSMQMERYNQLLLRWYQGALNRDADATNIVLKIMDKISQLHGIIPDKATIQFQQNSFNVNDQPVTFVIESANDNTTDNQIPATQPVLETGTSDIQPQEVRSNRRGDQER